MNPPMRFSPDGQMIATGNWAGGIKLLTVPNLEEKGSLTGHEDCVSGLARFPGATHPHLLFRTPQLTWLPKEGIALWSLDGNQPLATLTGHSEHVCRVQSQTRSWYPVNEGA